MWLPFVEFFPTPPSVRTLNSISQPQITNEYRPSSNRHILLKFPNEVNPAHKWSQKKGTQRSGPATLQFGVKFSNILRKGLSHIGDTKWAIDSLNKWVMETISFGFDSAVAIKKVESGVCEGKFPILQLGVGTPGVRVYPGQFFSRFSAGKTYYCVCSKVRSWVRE